MIVPIISFIIHFRQLRIENYLMFYQRICDVDLNRSLHRRASLRYAPRKIIIIFNAEELFISETE